MHLLISSANNNEHRLDPCGTPNMEIILGYTINSKHINRKGKFNKNNKIFNILLKIYAK